MFWRVLTRNRGTRRQVRLDPRQVSRVSSRWRAAKGNPSRIKRGSGAQSFGMCRVRLIISEPDAANINTSG